MSTSFSSSRSPGSARLQLGAVSRLRSSSLRKPPEPLRRAVADCLSVAASAALHGTPSAAASEASRTLRDYLANTTTTDQAYIVILEHTLAERERRLSFMIEQSLNLNVGDERLIISVPCFQSNQDKKDGLSGDKKSEAVTYMMPNVEHEPLVV
ncbi:hypothetical protein CK203_092809 [Vitis vinifera]|uniref:Uncharacterized protein n=1 Tax=Vitis vinifera TaxID=29760 RepID=A0A438EPG1_VITVI|nr:hypothetical protein CK203_092809 [Vitis vinifera]